MLSIWRGEKRRDGHEPRGKLSAGDVRQRPQLDFAHVECALTDSRTIDERLNERVLFDVCSGAEGRDEQRARLSWLAQQISQRERAFGVAPLQVVDDEYLERTLGGKPPEQLAQRIERVATKLDGVETFDRRVGRVHVRQPGEHGKHVDKGVDALRYEVIELPRG